jgi:hypothetical protein
MQSKEKANVEDGRPQVITTCAIAGSAHMALFREFRPGPEAVTPQEARAVLQAKGGFHV